MMNLWSRLRHFYHDVPTVERDVDNLIEVVAGLVDQVEQLRRVAAVQDVKNGIVGDAVVGVCAGLVEVQTDVAEVVKVVGTMNAVMERHSLFGHARVDPQDLN